MGKSLKEIKAGMSKKHQAKINARAAELIAEEMTMRDLRKARHLTQKSVAKKLGINQDNVSRLEKRSDVLISTLRSYIGSLGGELRIIAKFPNRPDVLLKNLTSSDEKESNRRSRHVSG